MPAGRAKERRLSGKGSQRRWQLADWWWMTWEDIWGGAFQAEGIASAKAMRLKCACCVWREKVRGREVGDRADCAGPYGLWEDLGLPF